MFGALDLSDFVVSADGLLIVGSDCIFALSFVDDNSGRVWLDYALNNACVIFEHLNLFLNFDFPMNLRRLYFFE